MNINEAFEKLKLLIEGGHGEAVLVHTDTRSGITEGCHIGHISIRNGEEIDFYINLENGKEYLSIYEG